MLPKKRRISTPSLLLALKRNKPVFSEHLSLRIHYLSPPKEKVILTQFAVITPSKINRLAVDRHLSKRKISACLENNLKLVKPNQYLIWQVKKDITKIKLKLLEDEIKNLLSQA